MGKKRLNKILAEAGCGSRRHCDAFIAEGKVSVDGAVVTEPGCQVDPAKATIRFDGRVLQPERKVIYILNKPKGYLSTCQEPSGARSVLDLIPGETRRLYPVGRLDKQSEGLLLMTNDGELAHRLTHPRYKVPKTYRVSVAGRITPEAIAGLQKGIWLSEGKTRPAKVRVLRRSRSISLMEITIREGKNRQLRRALAKLGFRVKQLKRIAMGKIHLKGLPRGAYRMLTEREKRLLILGEGGFPKRKARE
jgi:23S rRNA pseudouridine2605 synthase